MTIIYKVVLSIDAERIKRAIENTGVTVQILPCSIKGCYQPAFKKLQIKNGLPFGRSFDYLRLMESLTDSNVFYDD